MHCPETIKVCNKVAYICHHGRGDIPWEYRPRLERLNPLRYEVALLRKERGGYRIDINKDGRWFLRVSNGLFRIKEAWRVLRHGPSF